MTGRPDMNGQDDARHLRRAVELARAARERGDRPFGAVLVGTDGTDGTKGVVLAEGLNGATTTGDLRAHAELDAVTNAVRAGLGGAVPGSTVYASGEPCPMCAAGMVWAGVGRIVFAVATGEFTPLLGDGPAFDLPCAEVIARSTARIRVDGPVAVEGALEVFR